MPGRSSQSALLRYVGVIAAIVAIVGSAQFDWQFGAPTGSVPFALGVAAALLAVGWTLYRRV